MSTKIGPITKNTTYIPDFTIIRYPVTYNTNGARCEINQHATGSYDKASSNTSKYVYTYTYNTQFPNNDKMDVTCTSSGKTFVGWTTSKGSTDLANFKITGSDTQVFPVFADKISVKIQLGLEPVYTTYVDKNTTITNNQVMSSAISKINAGHYSDRYNLASMSDSIALYTSSTCNTLFSSEKIVAPTVVYIKPDPYVTFVLDDSKASFSDGKTGSKKIALSSLTRGEKIPTANISDQHKELSTWNLQTIAQKYPEKLSPNTQQLKDYKPEELKVPVTYKASFVLKKYRVTFKDQDNNCGNGVSTVIEVDANTIIDRNNTTFAKFNCSKAGHTFKGWQKESFTNSQPTYSYCPATNLILAIIMIVIIAYIVKYFANGFSNSRSRSVVLRNNKQL